MRHDLTPHRVITMLALVFGSTVALADPFSIEGPLSSVVLDNAGTGHIVCNGVTIQVTPQTSISSPTASLTGAQLMDSTPFTQSGYGPDGQLKRGFIGSTCIVDGDDGTGPVPVPVADAIFVEVAENVLVGRVSNPSGQPFAIAGVPVLLIPDSEARMPGMTPRNQFGFEIDISTVPQGDLAAAEGYLGLDGKLYAHTIETSGGEPEDATPRASIQRAECRDDAAAGRDRMEIRGGCVLPAGMAQANVLLEGLPEGGNAYTLGRTACVVDPVAPPFGTYRFRDDRLTLPGGCPALVRATLEVPSGGSETAAPVAR